MNRTSPARASLVVTSIFVAGLIAGSLTAVAAVARAQDPYTHLDLFARVLTTIERDYVDPVSSDDLVDAAVEGMVEHLDRQSTWLSSAQLQDLEDDTEGATTGIGVEVEATSTGVTITRVLPGSPALRNGLEPGDVILKVNGQSLAGLTASDVHSHFDGRRGEAAVLMIQRPGWDAPREVAAVRDRIDVTSVESARLDAVLYLRILQFHDGAAFELKTHLERHVEALGGEHNVAGVVLDLRDNPGGLLTEAVAVTDVFLEDGLIVATRSRKDPDQDQDQYHATPGALAAGIPIAVLINGMSASASEIVAAALQETGRATLVGEQTWGKGTVQQVYRHTSDAALKLTVGRYYTPSGEPVADRNGRRPDLFVAAPTQPTPLDELKAYLAQAELPDETRERLTALADAIVPPEPKAKPIAWDQPPEARLPDDPQLQAALDVLKR